MTSSLQRTLIGVAVCTAALFGAADSDAQAPVLRLVDSVRVAESDTFLLGGPRRLQVSPGQGAHYFVVDNKPVRLVEISREGKLVRVLGREGSGPAEFRQPTNIALSADTLLAVWDGGLRRVSTWDQRTGKHVATFPLSGWFPELRYYRGALRAGVIETDSSTAVITFGTDGSRRLAEGVRPEFFAQKPMFISALGRVLYADDGEDVYAVFEVANEMYHWKRGTKLADRRELPRETRKGVRPELFDEVLRDPSKAATHMYDRSIPFVLERIAPGMLALVTMDGELVMNTKSASGPTFDGVFHLSIFDVREGRACVDLVLPMPTDPIPGLTFRGDTLFAIQGGEDSRGDVGTWITRHRITTDRCRWIPMQKAGPVSAR